jgi:transcriptional regulator
MAFMQRHSFATLITAANGWPVATHLPFCVRVEGEELRLSAHLARANPQWRDLEEQPALVVFSGPHAYVSPAHYEPGPSVPTWNYLAVHAYGRAQLADPARTVAILEETIAYYDAAYRPQWEQLPAAYRAGMAQGIVAFDLLVTDLQAKHKLSQNRSALEQQRIREALAASEEPTARNLAACMRQAPPQH